jgi:hypothetical protein
MDAALLVERRHRFGPHHLATRGADRGKRHVWVDYAKRRPDHLIACFRAQTDQRRRFFAGEGPNLAVDAPR